MREQHGESKTRLYKIWKGMKSRCKLSKNYAGRGIKVCKEWQNSFLEFKAWALKSGYADNLSIDRIDNNGNYEPNNCRWTTQTIQSQNTRVIHSTNRSGYRGVSWNKAYGKWEVSIGVNSTTIKIGYYDTPILAAKAYDTYVIQNNLTHNINNVLQPGEEVESNIGQLLITTNTSGYVGVTAPKRIAHHKKSWSAQINRKNKRIFDMYCETALEAALYREHYIITTNLHNKRNFSDEEFNYLWKQLQETINETSSAITD